MITSKQTNKNDTVVAVFAHPDDEAFGPSGTLAKLAKEKDVYLLCATKGEAGLGNSKDLARIRSQELIKSAKIIGIKKVFFLGFIDGTLSNSLYHKLASKIEHHLKTLKPHTLITFENRGISGHIDHIAVSMVTTYVFHRLSFVKTLMYVCTIKRNQPQKYFIYFPPGYDREKIDKIVDISDVWDIKIKAMMAHKSQMEDAKRILKRWEGRPKEEYFLILNK